MLKALAQSELAKMIVLMPNAAVTVVANGRTASGLRNSKTSEPALTDEGETGVTTSKVFCNADTIGAITRGQSMTIDGVPVFATTYKVDSCGAIASIEYQEQKPK